MVNLTSQYPIYQNTEKGPIYAIRNLLYHYLWQGSEGESPAFHRFEFDIQNDLEPRYSSFNLFLEMIPFDLKGAGSLCLTYILE